MCLAPVMNPEPVTVGAAAAGTGKGGRGGKLPAASLMVLAMSVITSLLLSAAAVVHFAVLAPVCAQAVMPAPATPLLRLNAAGTTVAKLMVLSEKVTVKLSAPATAAMTAVPPVSVASACAPVRSAADM